MLYLNVNVYNMSFYSFLKYIGKTLWILEHRRIQDFILKYDNEENKTNLATSINSLKSKKEKKVGDTRSKILYEKGLIKNELVKMVYEKNVEIKSAKELKDCTFKPNILKTSQTLKNFTTDQPKVKSLYDRNLYWKNRANEK